MILHSFLPFFTAISNLSDSPVIIRGDFNVVLNPALDKFNNRSRIYNYKSSEIMKQFMADFGLGDGWRLKHHKVNDFSFFSQAHYSYSRIDYFLISNSIISEIIDIVIHLIIIISDHAPVTFTLNTNKSIKTSNRGRFNTSLLNDSNFDNYIKREWASFLEINDSPEIAPSLLWETGKVVRRGQIISSQLMRKQKNKKKKQT